jgi:hypothetical protein
MRDIAIYHVMKADEDFDVTAQALFQLVQKSQETDPGARRCIFLDIEGHKNEAGGFDRDAYEIITDFLALFLGQYVSRIVTPLFYTQYRSPQNNDIPGELKIERDS